MQLNHELNLKKIEYFPTSMLSILPFTIRRKTVLVAAVIFSIRLDSFFKK